MEASSKEKTAFITYEGHYEFTVMINAPATLQCLMEGVLQGLMRKSCLVYIDDILVADSTFAEHMENLRKVLERLRGANLKLKLKKCQFAELEVEYLGHVVSEAGIATDPHKVEAICNFRVPHNMKSLCSFLELVAYYRRFFSMFCQNCVTDVYPN